MTARRMVAAQREVAWQAADEFAAAAAPAQGAATAITPPVATQQVTWGELGCPRDIGLYRAAAGLQNFHGNVQIRVKRIHIIVAENDPAALFTVLALRPPLGPPEFVLGHRVA